MENADVSFWEVLQGRTSVRKYKEDPVPQEMLDKLLEAMKMAPVAGGNRNITCQVVTEREKIQHIADEVKRISVEMLEKIPDENMKKEVLNYSKSFYWFGHVPVLMGVTCRKTPAYMRILMQNNTEDLFGAKASAAMAGQNIMLAAQALGLGSCCLTGPLLAKSWVAKEIGCPGQNELAMLISVGFPVREKK
mgnify:FL=1